MEWLLPALVFALSANLDSFVVGITYGMRKIRIGWVSNVIISGIALGCTGASLLLGQWVSTLLPYSLTDKLGGLVLAGIGLYYCVKWIWRRFHPLPATGSEKYDKNASGVIEPGEAVVLGFALTINNVGLGLGAGLAKLNLIASGLLTTLFSVLSLIIGSALGRRQLAHRLGRFAEPIAGLVILLLGLYEVFF